MLLTNLKFVRGSVLMSIAFLSLLSFATSASAQVSGIDSGLNEFFSIFTDVHRWFVDSDSVPHEYNISLLLVILLMIVHLIFTLVWMSFIVRQGSSSWGTEYYFGFTIFWYLIILFYILFSWVVVVVANWQGWDWMTSGLDGIRSLDFIK